ncbi:hypothetical protein [Polymorphospora lycopeni]|uniref:Uncharacterized protein n=1 Tax=Polymorphospora lycopeni TaxID=3140240 RepID=A0ABV5CL11_9ACTN
MTDQPPDNLTKLTVNLIPSAVAALDTAATRSGDNRTDSLTRAIQVYAELLACEVGQGITVTDRDGNRVTWARVPLSMDRR